MKHGLWSFEEMIVLTFSVTLLIQRLQKQLFELLKNWDSKNMLQMHLLDKLCRYALLLFY